MRGIYTRTKQGCRNMAKAAKLRSQRPECHDQLVENGMKVRESLITGNKERALPSEIAAQRCLLSSYKSGAKDRSLDWSLTDGEFVVLIQGNCHYCGSAPDQKYALCTRKPPIFYLYNGVDRVRNEVGYNFGNCVSCCGRCNWWKGTLTGEEFLTHVLKIASHKTQRATAQV